MKLIGICGSSASGKTTLANNLREKLGCSIISQDNYYKDYAELSINLKEIDFANPNTYDTELLVNDLIQIKSGKDIISPNYSFITSSRLQGGIKIRSTDIVIIEGYALLYFPEIRELLDYAFFIDASEKIKLNRMIARDTVSRGCSIKQVYDKYNLSVKPNYEKYIKDLRQYANESLDGDKDSQILIKYVLNKIKNICREELKSDNM